MTGRKLWPSLARLDHIKQLRQIVGVFDFIPELGFDALDSEGMNLLICQLFAKHGEEVHIGRIVMSLKRSEDYVISQLVEPFTKLNVWRNLRRDVSFGVFDQRAEVVQTSIFRNRGKRLPN